MITNFALQHQLLKCIFSAFARALVILAFSCFNWQFELTSGITMTKVVGSEST